MSLIFTIVYCISYLPTDLFIYTLFYIFYVVGRLYSDFHL